MNAGQRAAIEDKYKNDEDELLAIDKFLKINVTEEICTDCGMKPHGIALPDPKEKNMTYK